MLTSLCSLQRSLRRHFKQDSSRTSHESIRILVDQVNFWQFWVIDIDRRRIVWSFSPCKDRNLMRFISLVIFDQSFPIVIIFRVINAAYIITVDYHA